MVSPKSSPFLRPVDSQSQPKRSHRAPRRYPTYEDDQQALTGGYQGSVQQDSARPTGLSDQRVSGLHDRVGAIRDIAIGLGDELQMQKGLLTEFDEDFERTGTIMDGTLRRFRTMAATQNGRYTLYMMAFVIGSFTFMYLYVKFR